MIDHIRRADGEQAAVEVLDTLRSLRQEHPGLRMVSRVPRIASRPGQYPRREDVQRASERHVPRRGSAARRRGRGQAGGRSYRGREPSAADKRKSAEVIAEEADCFPFYIHHIVAGLRKDGLCRRTRHGSRPGEARTSFDANDPWDLGHYRTRIPVYYSNGKNAELVGLVLDALAIAQEPMTVPQLRSTISTWSAGFEDKDELVRVLRLMERDHYLQRDPDGRIDFRFPLIQRWWALDRGL